jgi:hypothetical protein
MYPPASFSFSSPSVNQASTAMIAYAINAFVRRFIKNPGAQGWIRTTERRKGGQIYSLLALTAHPPVHLSESCNRRRACDLLSKNASRTKAAKRKSAKKIYLRANILPHEFGDTFGDPAGVRFSMKSIALLTSTHRRPATMKLDLYVLIRLRLRIKSISWSWRRDLNPRPSDYKSDALPAELRQR